MIKITALSALLTCGGCALHGSHQPYQITSFDKCLHLDPLKKFPIAAKFQTESATGQRQSHDVIFNHMWQKHGPLRIVRFSPVPYSLGDPEKGPLAPAVIETACFRDVYSKRILRVEITGHDRKPLVLPQL